MATPLSLREVLETVGVSKPTVLAWIKAKAIRANKRPTPLTPAGFVWEFQPSEVAKMIALKREPGRPKAKE